MVQGSLVCGSGLPLNGFYNGQTYNLIQKHGIYITNNYIITR